MLICSLHHWTDDAGPVCRYCQVETSKSFQLVQESYARERREDWRKMYPDDVAVDIESASRPADRWSWREVAYGALFVAFLEAIYVLAQWFRS